MSKLVNFLFLLFIILFGLTDNSKATYANADDFSDQQLKLIARKITISDNGKSRIRDHIIPKHKDLDESNAVSQGIPLSYFRLKNHSLDVYTKIINFVIDKGSIIKGQENINKKFSILAVIPNNSLSQLGAKENDSIGSWIRGEDYKKVSKVKVVFSVMNMKDDMKNLSLQDLASAMDQQKAELDTPFGDLITLFPIPNNWIK